MVEPVYHPLAEAEALEAHDGAVTACTYSGDGQWLVCCPSFRHRKHAGVVEPSIKHIQHRMLTAIRQQPGEFDHAGHDDHADHASDKEHSDHAEAHHGDEAGHTEFHAAYVLSCANPAAITEITFAYFDAFENARELEVQIVSASGAQAFEVERAAPTLDLRGMF